MFLQFNVFVTTQIQFVTDCHPHWQEWKLAWDRDFNKAILWWSMNTELRTKSRELSHSWYSHVNYGCISRCLKFWQNNGTSIKSNDVPNWQESDTCTIGQFLLPGLQHIKAEICPSETCPWNGKRTWFNRLVTFDLNSNRKRLCNVCRCQKSSIIFLGQLVRPLLGSSRLLGRSRRFAIELFLL